MKGLVTVVALAVVLVLIVVVVIEAAISGLRSSSSWSSDDVP